MTGHDQVPVGMNPRPVPCRMAENLQVTDPSAALAGDDARQKAAPVPHPGSVERLFRISQIVASDDSLAASMEAGPGLKTGPAVDAGTLAVLADFVFSGAAMRHRPPDTWAVTTELSLNFLRPVPLDGAPVRAEAQCLLADDEAGLSHGRILDAHRRILAHGTAWIKTTPEVPPSVRNGSYAPPVEIDTDAGTAASLAAVLQPQCTGIPGRTMYRANPRFINPHGTTHGGVLAGLAAFTATQHVREAGLPAIELSSLHVHYTRPITGDMTVAVADRHRGRSLHVVDVIIRSSSGQAGVHATVTFRRLTTSSDDTRWAPSTQPIAVFRGQGPCLGAANGGAWARGAPLAPS